MKIDHLTTKQVEQYCQTGYLGSDERMHLAGCPQCQRLVSDIRVIGRLMASAPPAKDMEHPYMDELQAFHDEALGFGRMKEIVSHLATCDYCQARVMKLRVHDAELEHSTPTPQIIEAARKQFRVTGRVRRLGQLIIQTIKDTGDVLLRLEPAAVSYREQYGKSLLSRDWSHDKLKLSLEDSLESHPDLEADIVPLASIRERRHGRTARSPNDTVEASSDDYLIRIMVSQEQDSLLLHLSISTHDNDEPARHMKVRLFAEDDPPTDAVTDQSGSVVLTLPVGPSLLQVDADPPIQLSIAGAD